MRRGFHYLCAVALGLAVLSKGPIGLAIPGRALKHDSCGPAGSFAAIGRHAAVDGAIRVL